MSDRCTFQGMNGYCSILTESKCEGCKFRKTEAEYLQAQVDAAEMLEKKNLIAVKKTMGNTVIMSTQYYKRW